MGAVHLARRQGAGDLCVVKQLRPEVVRQGVVAQRFLREAQISSLLVHPNIARLTDAWREADGNLYLAMEYVRGLDLEAIGARLSDRGSLLPAELALRIAAGVLAGLHHAHELRDADGRHLGLVHRDVAPKNVMVAFDGAVKLIDFGIARASVGDFRTAPGMMVGTVRYMSPEQAMAEEIDRRSDLYSACALLLELLTGRPLVTGKNLNEMLHEITVRPPPALSRVCPHLPPALEPVLNKALHKQRAQRHGSAEELSGELSRAAPQLRSTSRELGQYLCELFPEMKAWTDEVARRYAEEDAPEVLATRTEEPAQLATVMVPEASFVETADLPDKQTEVVPRRAERNTWRAVALLALPAVLVTALAVSWPDVRPEVADPPVLAELTPPEPEPPPSAHPTAVGRGGEEAPELPIEEAPPPRAPAPRARPKKAVLPLPPAAELPPDRPRPWEAEAEALIDQGRLEDATALLRRVLKQSQVRPEARRDVERCLAMLEHKFHASELRKCVAQLGAAMVRDDLESR